MRAARLLHCLLLLQNRGRMTATELARELEVSSRTILRDVEAMTEAGLPVIVHQGNRGGIELGFNYRMRLTGLTTEEADALGVILSLPLHELEALGLRRAGHMALSKIRELLPAPIRGRTDQTAGQFSIMAEPPLQDIPHSGDG
ncbi:helix-turn-helix transcriptional regulator [Halovulum sp. GXIMD14793]